MSGFHPFLSPSFDAGLKWRRLFDSNTLLFVGKVWESEHIKRVVRFDQTNQSYYVRKVGAALSWILRRSFTVKHSISRRECATSLCALLYGMWNVNEYLLNLLAFMRPKDAQKTFDRQLDDWKKAYRAKMLLLLFGTRVKSLWLNFMIDSSSLSLSLSLDYRLGWGFWGFILRICLEPTIWKRLED